MGPSMKSPAFLPQCQSGHQGNILQVPDLTTLHPVPWADKGKYKVGAVLCESRWMAGDTPHTACPRQDFYIYIIPKSTYHIHVL